MLKSLKPGSERPQYGRTERKPSADEIIKREATDKYRSFVQKVDRTGENEVERRQELRQYAAVR